MHTLRERIRHDKDGPAANERARILKALGHPSRLFFVERLSERPHSVCELAALFGNDVSTVSKHLSLLKKAGLVDDRRQGTTIYYSLRCDCIMDFIGCVETVIGENLKRNKLYLKEGGR